MTPTRKPPTLLPALHNGTYPERVSKSTTTANTWFGIPGGRPLKAEASSAAPILTKVYPPQRARYLPPIPARTPEIPEAAVVQSNVSQTLPSTHPLGRNREGKWSATLIASVKAARTLTPEEKVNDFFEYLKSRNPEDLDLLGLISMARLNLIGGSIRIVFDFKSNKITFVNLSDERKKFELCLSSAEKAVLSTLDVNNANFINEPTLNGFIQFINNIYKAGRAPEYAEPGVVKFKATNNREVFIYKNEENDTIEKILMIPVNSAQQKGFRGFGKQLKDIGFEECAVTLVRTEAGTDQKARAAVASPTRRRAASHHASQMRTLGSGFTEVYQIGPDEWIADLGILTKHATWQNIEQARYLAETLDKFHENKGVHCDFKPDNAVFSMPRDTNNYTIKIVKEDFPEAQLKAFTEDIIFVKGSKPCLYIRNRYTRELDKHIIGVTARVSNSSDFSLNISLQSFLKDACKDTSKVTDEEIMDKLRNNLSFFIITKNLRVPTNAGISIIDLWNAGLNGDLEPEQYLQGITLHYTNSSLWVKRSEVLNKCRSNPEIKRELIELGQVHDQYTFILSLLELYFQMNIHMILINLRLQFQMVPAKTLPALPLNMKDYVESIFVTEHRTTKTLPQNKYVATVVVDDDIEYFQLNITAPNGSRSILKAKVDGELYEKLYTEYMSEARKHGLTVEECRASSSKKASMSQEGLPQPEQQALTSQESPLNQQQKNEISGEIDNPIADAFEELEKHMADVFLHFMSEDPKLFVATESSHLEMSDGKKELILTISGNGVNEFSFPFDPNYMDKINKFFQFVKPEFHDHIRTLLTDPVKYYNEYCENGLPRLQEMFNWSQS